MNPELTAALARRHCRDLVTPATARPAATPPIPTRTPESRHPRSARRLFPRRLFPRYRLTWTRIPLALSDGARPRTTSWAIVISASRPADRFFG